MTMRVAYVKPYGEHRAGEIGFMPRGQAVKLCHQQIVMPATEYERKMQIEAAKLPKKKAPKKRKRKATSKKIETREKTVTN